MGFVRLSPRCSSVIRVLLVDDHVAFRETFAIVLDNEPDFCVIGQAESSFGARPWLTGVDLALIGLASITDDGIRLIRELRSSNAHANIIVMTSTGDRLFTAMAVEAGATGVLSNSTPLADVIKALRRTCAGEPLISPQMTIDLLRLAAEQRDEKFTAMQALNRLTPRELEILRVLADGLSDREIGERLNISTETVRTHFVHILGKLNVTSRIQALIFAMRFGVAKLPHA